MARLVREAHDLVLDRRAIAYPLGGDLTGIARGLSKVRTDQVVCCLAGPCHPAITLYLGRKLRQE